MKQQAKTQSTKYWLVALIFITLVIIIASVAGLIIFNNANAPKDYNFISGEIKDFSIDLSVKNPTTNEIKKFTSTVKPGENVFEFMKSMQSENLGFTFTYSESQYGTFIDGVDGYVADSNKQEFWKFFINNEPSQVGVMDYVLNTGDSIRWEIDHF